MMFKQNVEPIARYLFNYCRAPYDIVGQEQCITIETSLGKFFHYGYKVHYMKFFFDTLFSNEIYGDVFAAHNTLLIDDSPNKSICNDDGGAIFLDTWTHMKWRNDIFMGELLP